MKKSSTSSFNHNVFINCPIDEDYAPLFQAIVFTIHMLGFRPRCSGEANDSGLSRLEKIMDIMANCKYGIHDISRTQLDSNKLPRFNMPFELGVDLGYRHSGNKKYKAKAHLILDTHRYRFQKFISDLAGRDIFAHHNSPKAVILSIRTWLRTEGHINNMPSGKVIYRAYQAFKKNLPKICAHSSLDIEEINFADYSYIIADWLSKQKTL
jgi:hypothetical protein